MLIMVNQASWVNLCQSNPTNLTMALHIRSGPGDVQSPQSPSQLDQSWPSERLKTFNFNGRIFVEFLDVPEFGTTETRPLNIFTYDHMCIYIYLLFIYLFTDLALNFCT